MRPLLWTTWFIVALVCGQIAIMLFHVPAMVLYPFPEGLDMADTEAFGSYVSTLPAPAFLMVLAAHAGGAFVASLVYRALKRRPGFYEAIAIGGIFTICGIINLTMIPHPAWFAVLDTISYIPAALLAAALYHRFVHKEDF